MHFLSLAVAFLFFISIHAVESMKTATVHGKLQCKCDTKAKDCMKATVILMEDDGGSYDDEMAKIDVTIGRGYTVSGSEHEYFHIEPYLLINHACPDGKPKQKRINLDDVSSEKTFKMVIDLNE